MKEKFSCEHTYNMKEWEGYTTTMSENAVLDFDIFLNNS